MAGLRQFFLGFRRKHLFITTCIEKHYTRPLKPFQSIPKQSVVGDRPLKTSIAKNWPPWPQKVRTGWPPSLSMQTHHKFRKIKSYFAPKSADAASEEPPHLLVRTGETLPLWLRTAPWLDDHSCDRAK